MKTIISTEKAPKAIGPYSQATEAHGLIYISGQLPVDPASGKMAPADTAAQTVASLRNIKSILEAAGLTTEDILKTTVYMTDLTRFGEMNEAYGVFFRNNPPARAAFEVKALPKGALVEIEAVAAR